MKMTKVALAAVALLASTAALADGVTVSGIMDFGFGNTNGKGTYAENGAWADHSSITISGSEDMGSGLKAFFNLEAGFNQNGNHDNGGVGSLFSRQANIGLSSAELGAVTIGQQVSPFILAQALTNQGVGNFWVNRAIMGSPNVGAPLNTNATAQNQAAFFVGDSISYTTPSVAGFKLTALTSAKGGAAIDGAIPAPTSNAQYTSFLLQGDVAGANVIFATQNRKTEYSSWTIGAVYPLTTELSINANYVQNKNDADDSKIKSYALGASYKVAPAVTLIAQYADQTTNDLAAKQRLYNLAAQYALSKRTSTYITYTNGQNGVNTSMAYRGDNTLGTANQHTVAVGVAHSF